MFGYNVDNSDVTCSECKNSYLLKSKQILNCASFEVSIKYVYNTWTSQHKIIILGKPLSSIYIRYSFCSFISTSGVPISTVYSF